jgi:hypothetical protein
MRIIPLHLGFSYTFLLLKIVSVILLSNWPVSKNYDTANQYYFSPHAGRSLQVYHVYFPLGKQISSCHSDLVTASLPPRRVNCLISFPPLLLCHWFSNSASQCVKCSFFLQRKPFFFSKMIFQKICFVFENWNSQCLFTTMFKQFWGFVLNFLVKVISDEDKWWDDLLLWFSMCSSDYLNVFWEKK